MKRSVRYALGATALIVALAAAGGLLAYRRSCAAKAAQRQALVARLASLGIAARGDERFFALPPFVPCDSRAAALGAKLFHDRRLCAPAKRTCLTCHPLNAGGTDGQLHGGVLTRPVVNAALAEVFLRDASVTGLTAVVGRMITDRAFGGATNLAYSVGWIGSDVRVKYAFKKVFDDGVTVSNAVHALASYLRTLVTYDTPFDRHLNGHAGTLSPEAERGFAVFRARRCDTCHGGPALGAWQVYEGRKVPALRGLSKRRVYGAGGALRDDLSAVLPFMTGGDIESAEDRRALIAFLRTL